MPRWPYGSAAAHAVHRGQRSSWSRALSPTRRTKLLASERSSDQRGVPGASSEVGPCGRVKSAPRPRTARAYAIPSTTAEFEIPAAGSMCADSTLQLRQPSRATSAPA
eukprot:3270284-Prymnesium_polylepis.1